MRLAMRMVMLAYTNVPRLRYLPGKITDAISSADLIIHARDFTNIQLLKELKQLRETKAVPGNMDSRELETVLPVKEIFAVKYKRIDITHGSGGPRWIE
jgi:predicted phosphodiesterase